MSGDPLCPECDGDWSYYGGCTNPNCENFVRENIEEDVGEEDVDEGGEA